MFLFCFSFFHNRAEWFSERFSSLEEKFGGLWTDSVSWKYETEGFEILIVSLPVEEVWI